MPRRYEEWEISLHLTAITQAVIAWCPWIPTEGPAWNAVPWVVPCPRLGVRCYLDVTYAGRCGYIPPRRVWLSLPWTLWSCGEETTWISVRRSNGKTMLDARDVVQRRSGPLRISVTGLSGLSWGHINTLSFLLGLLHLKVELRLKDSFQEGSLTWREKEGFRALHIGLYTRLFECPHIMADGFPQSEWSKREQGGSHNKLSWPGIYSGTPFLLLLLLIRS